MSNSKEKILILAIFAISFLVRIAFMLFLRENYFFYNHPSTDVLFYQEWAKEIARNNWIGDTAFYGMPLYPYFLSILDRLTLGAWEIIRIIHLFLGSINSIFVYFIAKKIFSKKVAILSSILVAVNFTIIYYDWLMMPTTLLISLSCVIILSLMYLDKTSLGRQWFILGAMIGLAILGDGKFLIFFALVLAAQLLGGRRDLKKMFLRIFTPLVAGAFIILSVVTLRNFIITKDLIPISAHGGINFYIGNNPQATGAFKNPSFLRPYHNGHIEDPKIIAEATLKRYLRPSEVSSFWSNKALAFIRRSPVRYLKLLRNKAELFFTDNELTYDIDLLFQREWKRKLDLNAFRFICPLAILGIVIAIRAQNTLWINFIFLSQFLFTLIFFLINRHRATILPFMIIYESFAIFWFIDQIKTRNIKSSLAAGLSFFVFLLVLRPSSLDPGMIDFHKHAKAGPIYAENLEFQKAREAYLLALKLQPLDTNTLYNLGNLYVKMEEFEGSIKYYKKALRINPFDVDVTYNLAYSYEEMGDLNLASAAYKKVLSLQPGSPDAQFRIAETYRKQNNCPKAIQHYNNVIKLQPRFAKEVLPLIVDCQEQNP